MTVKVLLILVVVWVLSAFGLMSWAEGTPETIELSKPSLSSALSLDSDGDGMSDWFEENIAKYNPDIPNDRYIILYYRMLEDPGAVSYVIDKPAQFYIEKGKVPPENVITMSQEEANAIALKSALNQIARKSDKNDIVFLKILAHGSSDGVEGKVRYAELDEWLDQIEAKVVIVRILACQCEAAVPVLKDGPCPRIVYIQTGGEFSGAVGLFPEYAFAADTKYGNNDGYVSLKEISDLIDYDPMWGPDWGILYEKGRSFVEATGYSHLSDTSGIADQIYLTDYTPSPEP